MTKMRYQDAPEWAYRGVHPVKFQLTSRQVSKAVKKVPSFKMARIQGYFRDFLRNDAPDKWEYIRKNDGSTWLVAWTWFNARCFEIPDSIAKRFEALYETVESW